MSLSAGNRLGPYEVVSLLGAGGMGEVYRAKDARLNRPVAIKILSDESAADADRRERFEREAKAISALDHPNICALYDVGEHEGTYFLVMPCLEGQTLADRLAKGALPPDQAIKYAIEIATALDAAHRHGIIHRDLKPGHVMLTKPGVKLLDFGLAKLKKAAGPLTYSGIANLAGNTTQATGTGFGTLLGTMPYMAPEQVEGREVDARSDIFSLGAVVYEMVTGQRAFTGETAASVIGAILKDEPAPMTTLQPLTPASLDHVVTTCLAKDPDERWQSAADIARELKWIATAPPATKHATARAPSSRVAFLAGGVAMLAAVALLGLVWRPTSDMTSPVPVARLSIAPPPGGKFSTALSSIGAPQVAISPDGRLVAFVAETAQQRPHIWVRALDTLQPRMLVGTAEAMYPFWSPDDRSIGFFAEGKLKTINAGGGPTTTLSEAPIDSRGGSWSRDGTIIFAPSANDVIYRVPAAGGQTTAVTHLDKTRSEMSHRFPTFLPDGRHFAYVIRSQVPQHAGLAVASLDNPQGRPIAQGQHYRAEIVAPGALVFLNTSTLLGQPIDLQSLTVGGEPTTIAEDVGATATAYGAFSVSEAGHIVYAPRTRLTGELRWYSRTGSPGVAVAPDAEYLDFELSPDNRMLAVSRVHESQGMADIWTIDLERGISTRLTTNSMNDASVVWSPDGQELAFRSNRHGSSDVFRLRSNATDTEHVLLSTGSNLILSDWSASRRRLVFTDARRTSGFDIWTWDIDATTKPELAVRTRLNAAHGRLSPDGRWLAYASDESGHWQVYVQPFPATGERRQVSANGGVEPRWRGDGEELFFLSAAQHIMSVVIPRGNAFAAGPPRELFQVRVPLTENVYRTNYAVTRDGQRFLVNVSTGAGLVEPLTLILNWPALMKK